MADPAPQTDVVAHWNGLTKGELWSMSMGEVVNLMDDAVEEIERLRGELARRQDDDCYPMARIDSAGSVAAETAAGSE